MIKVANNLNVLFEKRSAISDYLNNDYVRYGGGGALAGAGVGALINKLMGGSALKGGLLGAGIGGGAGIGAKELMEYLKQQEQMAALAASVANKTPEQEQMDALAASVANRTPEEQQAARDTTAKILQLDPESPKNWLFPREVKQERTLALGGIDTESLKNKKETPFNFVEDAQEFMKDDVRRGGLDYLNALINYGNIIKEERGSKDPLGRIFSDKYDKQPFVDPSI